MRLLLAAGAVPPFLAEVVALFGAGAVITYICHRLGLVPIIGFLLAGVLIGPHALGLVRNQALVDAAAEIGVILLLFTIGIEFSLDRLARIKKLIFGGGTLQVVLTVLAATGLLMLFGVDWKAALFTGFLVALSSTAIVLKLLADRGETETERGQVGLGLLIFQDLAVIVMVLLVPMLGPVSGGSGGAVLGALATAALLIVGVLVVARRLMPPLLEKVARTCSPELFLLSVIAICFGTAFLTSLAGVSVSLGAFLAGLMVSESRFSQHAFGEVLPLQILFSAAFFISMGMLLDVSMLMQHLPLVFGVVAVVLVLKTVITAVGVRSLGYTLPIASASGLLLAQVGEFSFVLERAGRSAGLSPAGMGETGSQVFIASTVLLMVATPFLAQWAARLSKMTAPAHREMDPDAIPEQHAVTLVDHVIVAGYGAAARRIVPALAEAGIPCVVTTLSPAGALELEARGHPPVIRGDASRLHTLTLAGVARARLVAILDDGPVQAERIAAEVRGTAPGIRILVRTRAEGDAERLCHAGADRVISEDLAGASAVIADIMLAFGSAAPAETLGLQSLPEPIPEPVLEGEAASGGAQDRGASQDASYIDRETPVELRTSVGAPRCTHAEQVRPAFPGTEGCEECLRSGDEWVHLRICMSCGHVGCCDASKNRHATRHFQQTAHPVIRSLEPGETWCWCYEDQILL